MAEPKKDAVLPSDSGISPGPIRESYPEFYRLLLERTNEILPREISARANLDEQVMGSPGDEADVSVLDTSADYFSKLANSHQRELIEIREAVDRMHRGVYGVCESCEQPISVERLKKMPAARLCIDCQAQVERAFFTSYPGGKRSTL
jgi:DnaK suppressor protein